jgi:hypothetical protein
MLFTVLGASVGSQKAIRAGFNKTRTPQPSHLRSSYAREGAGEVAGTIPDFGGRAQMENRYKRAFSINTFCDRNEIGRTTAYAEINAGRLRASKAGKRTIITEENEAEWLKNLPAVEPKSSCELKRKREALSSTSSDAVQPAPKPLRRSTQD